MADKLINEVLGRDGLPIPELMVDQGDQSWARKVVATGAGGGAMTVADGADVNSGTTSDAANTTGATGTLSGKLRGLVTLLAAMTLKLPATLGQKTSAASLAVVVASDQSAVPISAASLPLPTGASTETTLAAQSAKLPSALGQTTMAASLSVAIASNQGAVPVSAASLPLPAGAATETSVAIPATAVDQTLHRMMILPKWTFTNITTAATFAAIKSGAGVLGPIQINNPGTSWVLTIYDSLTGTGTKIGTIAVPAGSIGALPGGFAFSTGLSIVSSGTPGDCTVGYL